MATITIVPVLVQMLPVALGGRLAAARKASELSQIDLGHLTHVGVSTARSLEAGYHGVSLGKLMKVTKALDLLSEVDFWLLPELDSAVVALGVRAVTRKRHRGQEASVDAGLVLAVRAGGTDRGC